MADLTTYSQLDLVDRYLPAKIRHQIEENYYARVNIQAELDYVAHNQEFLANPLGHVALFSDHGVVHVRDVAGTILVVLDAANGVLIPRREAIWLNFMKGYGVMLAYNHDIGMMDFSAFGRAMHPEFAAQSGFSPAYDNIVNTIWAENWGNISWRLINLVEQGALTEDPRLVLREMLAMSVGHSKSKVPIEVLNDPATLRQTMITSLGTNPSLLYRQQQVKKGQEKLAGVRPEDAAYPKLQVALETAKGKLEDYLKEYGEGREYAGIHTYYHHFEEQAYGWLLSEAPQTRLLVTDVIDTIRCLRVADALRQRGTTLKTSGGYQVFIDQNTANAVIALQKGSGEILMLETNEPLSIGEANMASSELTRSGDLRVSFHRGAFRNQDTTKVAAHSAAVVIDDIQKDTIQSFTRSDSISGLKTSDNIQILIEETDDNLAFSDLILAELKQINPSLGRRSRIVPSLKHVSESERARYLAASELDWSLEQRKNVLRWVAQSGHKTQKINPALAFTDVYLSELKSGQVLIEAGAPPGFVYIPMGQGLISTPIGGYQPQAVTPWIPLGNTRVIRGDIQEATITAKQDIKLLMLPKEIYLKYWHDTYNITEFSAALQQLYQEDDSKVLNLVLGILEQVAMIDGVLDEAEVNFILRFTESYGLDYNADDIRNRLLTGEPSDYVKLRQDTLDYLAFKPPHLQVARLRDLIQLLAEADKDVSAEEKLIMAELNSLLVNYLEGDRSIPQFKVYIVPQSKAQDAGIHTLLPDVPKVSYKWGHAYLCGAFNSLDYAEMIRERYRSLNLYAVVERENIDD